MRGLDLVAAPRPDAHRRGRARLLLAPSDNHHLVPMHFEKLRTGIHRLANEQLESPVGRLKVIALIFRILDAIHQRAPRSFESRPAR